MKILKEACVESLSEALAAEKRGADRIELCDNLAVGGTTQSYGTIKAALKLLNIPVFPIIRPRGGDFFYSSYELEIMREDIKMCKSLGAEGVVLGMLAKDEKNENKIDFQLVKEFVDLAAPMEVTFHKAIDELKDPVSAVQGLIDAGVKRILSSGTKATALEGAEILNKMIQKAEGKIIVVVAGGVTAENFSQVAENIISGEYHGKKIV